MSGTSLDGIDVSLVDFDSKPYQVLKSISHPFPKSLKQGLSELIKQQHCSLASLGNLDVALAKAYAQAVTALLEEIDINSAYIRAIGCHGQTIFHQPDGEHRFSMQIGSGAYLSELTSIPVITDFRNNDMALDGQGAPLVCAFHRDLVGRADNQMIINLGGIGNITWLPENGEPLGFDTGPANTLLDAWFQKYHPKQHYDEDGQWASSGSVNQQLLQALLNDPYFKLAAPKSTGREYFNLSWLDSYLATLDKVIEPNQIQATLATLTALSISQYIKDLGPKQVYYCGGGVRNKHLMMQLHNSSDMEISTVSELGIDPDYIEAIAFAWLAKQRVALRPGTISSVTGSQSDAMTGAIYQPSPPY